MFTVALRRLVDERLFELQFYEVAGPIIVLRNAPEYRRVCSDAKKNFDSRISAAY